MLNSGEYEYAEPDYVVYTFATPNDPNFISGSQWGLLNQSNFLNSIPTAHISAPQAWDIRPMPPW